MNLLIKELIRLLKLPPGFKPSFLVLSSIFLPVMWEKKFSLIQNNSQIMTDGSQ
jgi:hypothetical protein